MNRGGGNKNSGKHQRQHLGQKRSRCFMAQQISLQPMKNPCWTCFTDRSCSPLRTQTRENFSWRTYQSRGKVWETSGRVELFHTDYTLWLSLMYSGSDRGIRSEGLKLSLGKDKGKEFFFFSFLTILLAINLINFPQHDSVLLMTLTGKQAPCLNLSELPFPIFSLSCREEGESEHLVGSLALNHS